MHRKMLRRTCSVTAMEIKPREMAFSVAIVFVMLALGFLIGSKIGDHIAEENEKFTTAAQITADEQFQYALATDFGNVIAYGNLIAEQPGWVETENLSAGNDTPINEKVSVLSSSRFTLSHVQYISVRVYVCPFPSRCEECRSARRCVLGVLDRADLRRGIWFLCAGKQVAGRIMYSPEMREYLNEIKRYLVWRYGITDREGKH